MPPSPQGRIRELKIHESVCVEKEILAKHSCPFLVRGYFAMRSMQVRAPAIPTDATAPHPPSHANSAGTEATTQLSQHIYFVLEFCPGGDLLAMLRNCGCVPEETARFYLAEVRSGRDPLFSVDVSLGRWLTP